MQEKASSFPQVLSKYLPEIEEWFLALFAFVKLLPVIILAEISNQCMSMLSANTNINTMVIIFFH